MPVVLRVKSYKFWFYEADLDEPPHIHIGKQGKEAKYWLDPVKLARAGGLKSVNLREVERILHENCEFLLNAWKKELSKRADR